MVCPGMTPGLFTGAVMTGLGGVLLSVTLTVELDDALAWFVTVRRAV
jgi:hypothetical protein